MKPEINLSKTLLLLVHHESCRTRFSKPDQGRYENEYWVKQGDTKDAVIFFNRGPEGKNFPLYVQFEANLPITAVGFAERGGIPKCTVRGCCGGCFYLESDVRDRDRPNISPLIRNFGANPLSGYRFKLWLLKEGGEEHEIEIDPRIYNEGDTEPPILRRLLRKLVRLRQLLSRS